MIRIPREIWRDICLLRDADIGSSSHLFFLSKLLRLDNLKNWLEINGNKKLYDVGLHRGFEPY
jgi:hypothetical protein